MDFATGPGNDSASDLEARLAAEGKDYLLCTPLPAQAAEVLFLGPLGGRRVIWRMRLCTLTHFRQEHGPLPTPPLTPRGAMLLLRETDDHWRAHVGLALPEVDEPAVRKAIVMMRNYRALRPGLRVWGD